jgi:hypothetical protein
MRPIPFDIAVGMNGTWVVVDDASGFAVPRRTAATTRGRDGLAHDAELESVVESVVEAEVGGGATDAADDVATLGAAVADGGLVASPTVAAVGPWGLELPLLAPDYRPEAQQALDAAVVEFDITADPIGSLHRLCAAIVEFLWAARPRLRLDSTVSGVQGNAIRLAPFVGPLDLSTTDFYQSYVGGAAAWMWQGPCDVAVSAAAPSSAATGARFSNVVATGRLADATKGVTGVQIRAGRCVVVFHRLSWTLTASVPNGADAAAAPTVRTVVGVRPVGAEVGTVTAATAIRRKQMFVVAIVVAVGIVHLILSAFSAPSKSSALLARRRMLAGAGRR